MPAESSFPLRFAVHRLNWQFTDSGFVRLPGEFRVASFATQEEAESERSQREEAARRVVNPFAGGLAPFEQTSMPEGVLCAWLQEHGFIPPIADAQTGRRDWAAWWNAVGRGSSAGQRRAAWAALDKVRFYEVAAQPQRPVVYAVALADQHYYDSWYVGLRAAYRDRGRAEAECARANTEQRAGADLDEDERDEWKGPDDPFLVTHSIDSRHFEDRPLGEFYHGVPDQVVAIEVDGGSEKDLYVVARATWVHIGDGFFRRPMEGGDGCAFVRAFFSRRAAEAFCKEQESKARAFVPPGRFDLYAVRVPPVAEFNAAVHELGLPPLPPEVKNLEDGDGDHLLRWWETVGSLASAQQRLGVWDSIPGLKMFEVIATTLKD